MRVLHVINGLGTGGAERSLAEMLPRYRAAGIDSAVACLVRRPQGVHEAVEAAGFPVHVVGLRRPLAAARIRDLIGALRPDLVHTTIFEADVLGRVAATGCPCRVVSSLVNTSYDGARLADSGIRPWKLAAARSVDRMTGRWLTHRFHAISRSAADSAVTHLGIAPTRISVVERGRDLQRLGQPSPARRAAVREQLGIAPDCELLLNVGRQEPQKGQLHLVEAMASLAHGRPRIMLLQAGRVGRSTAALSEAVSRHGLEDRVRFLGHREDIGDLLAAADVFAFPSVYEGLGGGVLEAMAMSVPVVASDIPALTEVLENGRGGVLVPKDDSTALAASLASLLDDTGTARQIAAVARSIFDARFTIERSVQGMVQLYERVLEEGDG